MPEPDELPTLPPPPRAAPTGLRWAGSSSPPGHRPAPRQSRPTERLPFAPEPPGERADPTVPLASPVPASQGPASQGPGLQGPVSQASSVTQRLPTLAEGPQPAPRPRRRWSYVVAAVAALAALAAVALAVVLPRLDKAGAGKATPSADLSSMLSSLSGADRLTRLAVDAACAATSPGPRQPAVSDLDQAEASDRAVLSSLDAGRARLATWPAATPLLGPIAQVARASLAVEGDYQAWVSDLEATGCFSAPRNDLNYEQAQIAASSQSAAAGQLARVWAPLARRYGLRPSAVIPL